MQHKTIDNDPPPSKAIGRQQARRLELQRITQENQRLLKRIQETEPAYNHLEWEEDAKKRAAIIANMSEFSEANTKIPMHTVSPMKRSGSDAGKMKKKSGRVQLDPL